MKRMMSLMLALLLVCGAMPPAKGEDTSMPQEEQTTHFVPENPENMPVEGDGLPLDLRARKAVGGQERGEDTETGVLYAGGTINKSLFELPFVLNKGQKVTVTVTGRFLSDEDASVRFLLANENGDGCNAGMMGEIANNGTDVFMQTFDLHASASADYLMLTGGTFSARFKNFELMAISVSSEEGEANGKYDGISYEEAAAEPWYQDLLKASQMRLGNNKRLHALVKRAQAGEKVTVSTIGGSITEGAGATRYKECYAYQIYEGFRQRYGVNGGENVAFINAGVGGTPSPFGLMRYQSEIVDRVKDDDGLPDLVVIEFSVNDYGEPTKHRAFESMVKRILEQPNEPVVIILFAVFENGFNLQHELRCIGDTYDVMMVSILDGAYPYVGDKWTSKAFFFDQYHPTTLGHKIMADCVLSTIEASLAQPESETDVDLTVAPAYGTEFENLVSIMKGGDYSAVGLNAGSFRLDDTQSYRNQPVGRVCGENFHHAANSGNDPLTFTASFKNLMIAYRTVTDTTFGNAEVYIDGKKVATLKANTGSWGQSVVDLVWDKQTAEEHTVAIRMAEGEEGKKFTITCISYTPD